MKFIGREEETSIIGRALSEPSCFVVLTGRRRIGKTRLVREALKEVDHIEIFIARKRLPLVLKDIRESIREQTGYSPTFSNFRELFEYLFRIERRPVFIDEISNLAYVDPGAVSDLQYIYDKEKENGVHLIVDGSYVGVMEKLFTERKEPLFGRATDLIYLRPLPVEHAVEMCMEAGFDLTDSLEAYSLLGGVPRYLELLSRYGDVDDLARTIFTPGSLFMTEAENVLIQEFGGAWATYFSLLEVIADGRHGPSAIANRLGMPVPMIPKYLETLMRLQLIGRGRPVLGKERHVRYRIQDPFFQLWFDVCHPRMEQYRDGTRTVKRDRISAATGRGMERVVAEILGRHGVLPFEADGIGGWWDRTGHEIDILAYSRKGKRVAVGEVKWTNRPAGADAVKKLLDNLELVDWHNNTRTEYAVVVSKSGFTNASERLMRTRNVLGLGPDDLEGVLFREERPEWSEVS